ncbi:MAG: DNA polymerase III subunit chi [Candidatus Liberibacter ctenarytainae]|uniref:DNA polymerase III subunit chi n=1 Tax=Candidatus Liberibacter ctenarytainae TaxID=2020335 RepID=A0A937AJF2_9HYPH|nr:DNA polymerase III subunit chi [Candidatus Liberibacter ctenarytainae]
MTEFIFYRLKDNWQSYLLLLLEKAYHNNQRVSVQCGSDFLRDSLDDYLWTWKEDSFLPHGVDIRDEGVFSALQPILLTLSSDNANASTIRFFINTALINTEDIGYYKKLIFIVDNSDQESRRWGRENWIRLKNAGYELTVCHNDLGYWKKIVR